MRSANTNLLRAVPRVTASRTPWHDAAAELRPFLARRLDASEVDDVMQDVFVRIQRGLPGLRDEERFTAWLFQIARSSIAEHLRMRARHPLMDASFVAEIANAASDVDGEDVRALACCVVNFVARLPSPYREAVTLVELEGMTVRDAASHAGVSVSGLKSRVQRGRAQLRQMFEECCEIALDARGKVIDYTPRPRRCTKCK